jgi:ABC-type uncharacterized transport system auxiliary subunit
MIPRCSAALLLLTLAACTPLLPTPSPAPPEAHHVLEPATLPAARGASDGAPRLAVIAVRPGPRLDGREMLYRDAQCRAHSFAANRWIAPPEAQLGDWLVSALERAGGVVAVIAPGGRGRAALLLESELLFLELDSAEAPGTLRVELRLQLLADPDREVLATVRLQELEALDAPGPAAMADAAGRALGRLLEASASFVREAVAAQAARERRRG